MSTKPISALCAALICGLLANMPAIAEEKTDTAKQAKESVGGGNFDSPPPAPTEAITAEPSAGGAGEQTADEQVDKSIDGTSFDAPPEAASGAATTEGTADEAPEKQVKKSIDGADF